MTLSPGTPPTKCVSALKCPENGDQESAKTLPIILSLTKNDPTAFGGTVRAPNPVRIHDHVC